MAGGPHVPFHATEAEAAEEVAIGLEAYRAVAEDWLYIPVISGRKSEGEVPGRRVHALHRGDDA
ncbi:MAG: hypothetical protein R3C32_11995 [Chloroflexota bacterium]